MKPEEVLKILDSPFDEHPGSLEQATKTIIQALEKQVAKSYDIRCNSSGVCYDCPECGVKINRYDKYCFNCGQKIDWKEK